MRFNFLYVILPSKYVIQFMCCDIGTAFGIFSIVTIMCPNDHIAVAIAVDIPGIANT
jgi:hypothetical protein